MAWGEHAWFNNFWRDYNNGNKLIKVWTVLRISYVVNNLLTVFMQYSHSTF